MFGLLKTKLSYSDFGHLATTYVSDIAHNNAGRALGFAFDDADGSNGWVKFLLEKGVDQEGLVSYYRSFLHAALQCGTMFLPDHARFTFMQGSDQSFAKSPPGYDFVEFCEALEVGLETRSMEELDPLIIPDFRIPDLPNPWSAYIASEFIYERSAEPLLAQFDMRPGSFFMVPAMRSAIVTVMSAVEQISKRHRIVE